MILIHVGRWVAIPVVLFTLLPILFQDSVAAAQEDNHIPHLLFDVSDEDLDMPLGIVSDVAVARDRTLCLLDTSNEIIHRITIAGEPLGSIGRSGQGPGDLSHPWRLTVMSDDRCIVLQNFSRSAACLMLDGADCPTIDVSVLRSGYTGIYYDRIESTPTGDLLISAQLHHGFNPGSDKAPMPIASVLRISQTGNLTETLFSTQRDPSQNGVIPLPGEAVRFVLFGWDLNAEGDLIYADPAGLNKVNIRYSTDGRDAELRLPNPPEDVLDFRKLLDSLPSAANRANVPRIASVRWLDSEYFMTRPAAKWAPPTIETAGVFDVYSREGQSYGRFNISIPYDPSNDEIFIRGDLLILIQGGKSVARAHFALLSQTEPDLPEPSDVEEIRVRVYRLFKALRER